jgi:4-oxalocrotonate tautomerase
MPVINVAMHKVGEEMKTTLIRELTNVAAEVTKIPLDRFTILIDEFDDENIGCAGKTLKELKASR